MVTYEIQSCFASKNGHIGSPTPNSEAYRWHVWGPHGHHLLVKANGGFIPPKAKTSYRRAMFFKTSTEEGTEFLLHVCSGIINYNPLPAVSCRDILIVPPGLGTLLITAFCSVRLPLKWVLFFKQQNIQFF